MAGPTTTGKEHTIDRIKAMAKAMRLHALHMAFSAGSKGSHVGSGLSIVDLMAVLYGGILKLAPENPRWENRDRFILSKGHGTLGYYTALAEAGYFSVAELYTFEENDGFLPGQPTMNMDKGIEFSSGSLGLGLSLGVGVALNAKRHNRDYSTFVLMGNGECNEGSVWEAAMAAAHFKLDRLIAIIDHNQMQSDGKSCDVMDMGDLSVKWRCFGWETVDVDGHDVEAIYKVLSRIPCGGGRPFAVIAHTVKGKGVSFMEHNNEWHHSPLSRDQYDRAVAEINSCYADHQ